ncbi:hypothetical protein [Streptomyces chartreusis]|uniref:hypothetical protein n=1 Tax=Streptomyces chartreusis TaxID=1969 RepID=UPI003626AF4C
MGTEFLRRQGEGGAQAKVPQRLLAAAPRLLAERGYHGMPVREIVSFRWTYVFALLEVRRFCTNEPPESLRLVPIPTVTGWRGLDRADRACADGVADNRRAFDEVELRVDAHAILQSC